MSIESELKKLTSVLTEINEKLTAQTSLNKVVKAETLQADQDPVRVLDPLSDIDDKADNVEEKVIDHEPSPEPVKAKTAKKKKEVVEIDEDSDSDSDSDTVTPEDVIALAQEKALAGVDRAAIKSQVRSLGGTSIRDLSAKNLEKMYRWLSKQEGEDNE